MVICTPRVLTLAVFWWSTLHSTGTSTLGGASTPRDTSFPDVTVTASSTDEGSVYVTSSDLSSVSSLETTVGEHIPHTLSLDPTSSSNILAQDQIPATSSSDSLLQDQIPATSSDSSSLEYQPTTSSDKLPLELTPATSSSDSLQLEPTASSSDTLQLEPTPTISSSDTLQLEPTASSSESLQLEPTPATSSSSSQLVSPTVTPPQPGSSTVQPEKQTSGKGSGAKVAAGVCVSIIFILAIVAGIFYYRRCYHAKRWTPGAVSFQHLPFSNRGYQDDEGTLILPNMK